MFLISRIILTNDKRMKTFFVKALNKNYLTTKYPTPAFICSDCGHLLAGLFLRGLHPHRAAFVFPWQQ